MNNYDIVSKRLKQQMLIGSDFNKPFQIISWFGIVQAQVFAAAKWTLSLRVNNKTDMKIEDDFDKGFFYEQVLSLLPGI